MRAAAAVPTEGPSDRGRVPPPSPPGPSGPPHPESWLTLYRELGERVFRLIHRMTGDEELARDLTHDTFVVVFERLEQFGGRGELSAWVFKIAGNLVRERTRTHRRRVDLLEQEFPSLQGSVSDDSGRLETQMVLEEVLQHLPEDLRITLLLHDVDGYTHTEIGEMTGVTEGSSRARLARAKAELRRALKGKV